MLYKVTEILAPKSLFIPDLDVFVLLIRPFCPLPFQYENLNACAFTLKVKVN